MTEDLCIYLFARSGAELAIKINNVKREFNTYATTINTVVTGGEFSETQHHAWVYHSGAKKAVVDTSTRTF